MARADRADLNHDGVVDEDDIGAFSLKKRLSWRPGRLSVEPIAPPARLDATSHR